MGPFRETVANGGWAGFLTTNPNQGALCWTNYLHHGERLGESPKLVICPADERQAASNFTNQFGNTNVSYFVGVSANDSTPLSPLPAGDRNLGPGASSPNNYGYSPNTGKGNNVAIPTNSAKGPVSWSLKMHSSGRSCGVSATLCLATAAFKSLHRHFQSAKAAQRHPNHQLARRPLPRHPLHPPRLPVISILYPLSFSLSPPPPPSAWFSHNAAVRPPWSARASAAFPRLPPVQSRAGIGFSPFSWNTESGLPTWRNAYFSIPKGLHHSAQRWPDSERAYAGLPHHRPQH